MGRCHLLLFRILLSSSMGRSSPWWRPVEMASSCTYLTYDFPWFRMAKQNEATYSYFILFPWLTFNYSSCKHEYSKVNKTHRWSIHDACAKSQDPISVALEEEEWHWSGHIFMEGRKTGHWQGFFLFIYFLHEFYNKIVCVCVFQCQPTALLRASGSAQGR